MLNRDLAQSYKHSVASKYIPVSHSQIIQRVIDSDWYAVSTKYDGHFYLLCYGQNGGELVNTGESVIRELPLLNEVTREFSKTCSEIILAGELYAHHANGRTRVFDLVAALSERPEEVRFAAFDILSLDGEIFKKGADEIHTFLNSLLSNCKAVHPVHTTIVDSRKEIESIFQERVIEGGQEGIVVKPSKGPTYKVKPLVTIDAVVLGYSEGEGPREGMLRDLLIGLNYAPDEYLLIAKVGNGFTDNERIDLLAQLRQLKVQSDYIEVSGSNVAMTMVEPRLVTEVSCLDVITNNSKGAIQKIALTFQDGVYRSVGKRVSVSLTTPVFIKIRDDKKPSERDTGLSQVTRIVSLDPQADSEESLPKGELLKREVYVKESKGKKMIRKFVLLKTNKESTGDYPAFVYHFTDFSPSRAEMLKKDVQVSSSRPQIEKIFEEEIQDKVKKGWVKYDRVEGA